MTALEDVLANNLRRYRTERGWRQADLAERMAALGMGWTPNRVAQVETLRRGLALDEIAALCLVLDRPAVELLAGEEDIDLPAKDILGRTTVPLADLRRAITSGAPAPITDYDTSKVFHVATDESRKAAAKLGVSTHKVEATAKRLWGRSLRAERDYRAGDLSEMPARSAQAKRGHIMRELLHELHLQLTAEQESHRYVDERAAG